MLESGCQKRGVLTATFSLYNRKVLRTSLSYKKPSGRDAHSREWKMLPSGNRARRENSTLWNSFS